MSKMELLPAEEQSPEAAAAMAAAQQLTELELASDTSNKYEAWRSARRPFEVQWYLNASALRGFPDVRWNAELSRLEMKREPAHRKRFRINHIKPKYVARVAKYTRIPPNPTVVPASTDREDIFDSKATQKALEYFTRKGALRSKWMQSMQWVPVTGKSFWAVRWNDDAISHAPTKDEGGRLAPILGEVEVEHCSAFEILNADPSIEMMGDQPEIIRARLLPTREIELRFELEKGSIAAESADVDLFFYQRQIADLGTRQSGVASRSAAQDASNLSHALLLEHFIKPTMEYPQGRYRVVVGAKVLRHQDSMPGGFSNLTRNPYPFVEFADDAAPGQFWPDAFIERMIGLQSEYNEYRSKLGENLAVHFFPKLVVPKQLGLGADAYTSEAGERLDVNWIPGIPMPSYLQPSSVISDAWNILSTLRKEMDDVTLIYPAALGGVGGSSSGFQTSLLQEAADQVHGPTIQRNAIALEEAYVKIRHLMKQFYDVPRMITIAGRASIPEVYEFSKATIDEHADIRIEPDTMMPQLRSVRVDQIRQMFTEGLFGPTNEEKTRLRAQDMLKVAFSDFEIERDQRDMEQAQLENIQMTEGAPLAKPQPWEAHQLHWESHIDLFKSPEAKGWGADQLRANVFHALNHLIYLNPEDAKTMAREFNLTEEVEAVLAVIAPTTAPVPPPPDAMAPPMAAEAPMGMPSAAPAPVLSA